MENNEVERVKFVCENCGFDCGMVQSGFSKKCPHCGSALSYDGLLYSCYRPSAPLWIPSVAWILLVGGVSHALLQTNLAGYGLPVALLSLPFFLWHKKNKDAERHALNLNRKVKP